MRKKNALQVNLQEKGNQSIHFTTYHMHIIYLLRVDEPFPTALIFCESLKQTKCTMVLPLG